MPSVDGGRAKRLHAKLLGWYATAKRDLPWRRTRDPYAIWLSETMLQQTRVETVIPYYERFLARFPTAAALAEAREDDVLALWSGLGYYRRARLLHAAARTIAREHGGRLPREVAALQDLEGVGAYTAGAVASIAYGERAAVVDGNVARVLARIFAIEDDVKTARGKATLWKAAESLVPAAEAGDWNQSLMELGATVCTPRAPACSACPVASECKAHAAGLAASLPRASRKKQPLVVRRVAVVLASPRGVLLARRRRDVLFGGLWEPPSAPVADRDDLVARLGIEEGSLEHAGEVTHVLSHRRMSVDVLRGALGRDRSFAVPTAEYEAVDNVGWDALASRARASLTRKILEVANVAPSGLRLQLK